MWESRLRDSTRIDYAKSTSVNVDAEAELVETLHIPQLLLRSLICRVTLYVYMNNLLVQSNRQIYVREAPSAGNMTTARSKSGEMFHN